MVSSGVLLFSFIVGSIFTILNNENAGSYAVAIASILGIIITLIYNRKDSKKQTERNELNIIIQTTYRDMKKALIELKTFLNEKVIDFNKTNDA
jgi:hypothetical protein